MNADAKESGWISDLQEYCRKLNIPIEDLHKVLIDPKVAPMVRGKAFEFSVSFRLSQILPDDEWTVSKPIINAQTGSHDVDVKVLHNKTGKVISVECKLASKGGFKVTRSGEYVVPVKCMRSRTTKTPAKVKARAKELGISAKAFLAHSDQYRANSFDVVITSLGNAFYETDEETMLYEFRPGEEGLQFISKFNPPMGEDLQTFVYNKVYVAKSKDLIVSRASGVVCGKRACANKYECGFIPNYPLINFGRVENLAEGTAPKPINRWVEIENARQLFEELLR